MLEHAATVATQALQVWMTEPPAELGPIEDPNPPGMVSGAYVKPLDTLCDMTHLLGREGWPQRDGVRSIGYFCGTMQEPESDTQQAADERAFASGVAASAGQGARCCGPALSARASSGAFDWELLFDPTGASGEDRVRAQYWRANIFGSERYVLTPPGSIAFRLRPSEADADQPRARRRLDAQRHLRRQRRGGRNLGPARRAASEREPRGGPRNRRLAGARLT